MTLEPDRRKHWLRSFGILVIAVLALASAGHFWHHLTDDCESRQSFPHPCAQCAGFHGGVLSEAIQVTATPRLVDLATVCVAENRDRTEQPRGFSSTRAPPLI
ncbi:MAG: hypothetical protein E6K80_04845 [Candidatus Eisenbacteria bacterium]|uniref:Uncharacterized protein n=1 Tax=Eiseniibacteriota bacterium TaxID=2212470 RepID=A0A538U6Z6_UNCEI|nr:MAG: hypothetical protein E6K80_04845 [Candidatus Eisenbacteria bacterium]